MNNREEKEEEKGNQEQEQEQKEIIDMLNRPHVNGTRSNGKFKSMEDGILSFTIDRLYKEDISMVESYGYKLYVIIPDNDDDNSGHNLHVEFEKEE